MPITSVTLTYDHTGIRTMNAYNFIQIISEEEPVEVISGYDALQVLVDEYAKIIIECDIHIVSAQLCYLLFPEGEDGYSFSLEPGWIFTSRTVYDGQITKYRYDVVDAVNGKLHPGRF